MKKKKCDGFRQVLLKGFLRDGLCAPYELASSVRAAAVLCSFFCHSSQSEQKAKKGEDLELDPDDEKIGEEDSQFMKLAKKLTAKTLQRKG